MIIPPPRKCETPRCKAPPCPTDWDDQGIDQAHKKRPAWVWTCECGWKCIRPTLQLSLGEARISLGLHLDDVVERAIVGAGEQLVETPRVVPVLLDVSKDGLTFGLEVKV